MEHPQEDIAAIIHTLTQAPPTKQRAAIERYFTPTCSFTHPFCATGSWSLTLPYLGNLDSRWATLQVYQWYKILSPRIDLQVISVTFNEENLKLYVDMHQHFRLWMVPGYHASVNLTTVLQLVEGDESGSRSVGAGQPRSQRPRGYIEEESSAAGTSPSYAAVADPDADTHIDAASPATTAVSVNENSEARKLYYITSQNDLYQTSEFIKFLVPWGIGVTLVSAWQLFATLMCVVGAVVLFPVTYFKERTVGDGVPRKI